MRNLVSLDVNNISSQVAEVLKQFSEVAGAYLFGSVLGACRPDSDIDLGLVLENLNLNDREQSQFEAKIANALSSVEGHPFDISLIDIDNPIFSFKIIKEGRLIYVRNYNYITDIMELVSKRYAEVYPRYRMAMEQIIAEVIYNGG